MFKMNTLVFFLLGVVLITFACSSKVAVKFVTCGHRGASGWAPENTLPAFTKAMEMGADYSELDVRLSKDGFVVLSHDDSLVRTAKVKCVIRDFTLAELQQMDVGSWFAPEYQGVHVPTLQEVIRLVKGKMKLNIEIKIGKPEPELAQKVIDVIRAEGFTKECMITSFDKSTVEKFAELAPELPVGLIFNEKNTVDVFAGSWPILSAKYTLVNADFVRKARAAGKQIYAWTVNDEEKMRELIGLKIDGIITNYPDKLKKVVDDMQVKS